jgi:hypothetical protein
VYLSVYCLPCSPKFLLHKAAVLRLVAVQLGQLLCHRPVRIIFPAFGIGIHNRASGPCDASLSPSRCSITAFTWAATQSHAVARITSDTAREVSNASPACLVRGGDKSLRQRQRRVTTPPRPDGGAQWSLPQIGRSPAQLAQEAHTTMGSQSRTATVSYHRYLKLFFAVCTVKLSVYIGVEQPHYYPS